MRCKRLGLKDHKAENEEGLLRMPVVGSCIDTHQEQALKMTSSRLLPCVQTWYLPFHGFTSTDWA